MSHENECTKRIECYNGISLPAFDLEFCMNCHDMYCSVYSTTNNLHHHIVLNMSFSSSSFDLHATHIPACRNVLYLA
jgi:hypothetical protein